MSQNTNSYPKSSDINPNTGRPYGLGTPAQKLDPVIFPDGHMPEQQKRAAEARMVRAAEAVDKAAKREGRPSRIKQTVAGVAVASIATAGAIVASRRDNEYLKRNTPIAPVTTVAPGIQTQEQLDQKNAADTAAETGAVQPASVTSETVPHNGE